MVSDFLRSSLTSEHTVSLNSDNSGNQYCALCRYTRYLNTVDILSYERVSAWPNSSVSCLELAHRVVKLAVSLGVFVR